MGHGSSVEERRTDDTETVWGMVAQWKNAGLMTRRGVARNFGNSVYPTIPVSFGGGTKH